MCLSPCASVLVDTWIGRMWVVEIYSRNKKEEKGTQRLKKENQIKTLLSEILFAYMTVLSVELQIEIFLFGYSVRHQF